MVRRCCAALLLMVYGLVLGMPLVAMARGPESRLPACCRRDGKHHCAMQMAEAGAMASSGDPGGEPRWVAPVERCPMFPATMTPMRVPTMNAGAGAQPGFALAACLAASVAQADVWRRVARECARHKRGPPSGAGLLA